MPVPTAPVMERAVAASNVRVQLLVHELPAPNATVPPPEPANVTLTSQVLMKLVLAVASEFSVNEQEAPVQALLKASKREPEAAAGVRLTAVPSGSSTEQVPLVTPALDVHEIAGVVFEETMPEPLPDALTVSVCTFANVAVTLFAALMVSEQEAPVQSPEKPEKMLPFAGDAVRVSAVPASKLAEHVVPQATPEGLDVTVPAPVPAKVTPTENAGVSQTLAVPLAAHV